MNKLLIYNSLLLINGKVVFQQPLSNVNFIQDTSIMSLKDCVFTSQQYFLFLLHFNNFHFCYWFRYLKITCFILNFRLKVAYIFLIFAIILFLIIVSPGHLNIQKYLTMSQVRYYYNLKYIYFYPSWKLILSRFFFNYSYIFFSYRYSCCIYFLYYYHRCILNNNVYNLDVFHLPSVRQNDAIIRAPRPWNYQMGRMRGDLWKGLLASEPYTPYAYVQRSE